MTHNEKRFLKKIETLQRETRRELKTLEKMSSQNPGLVKPGKLSIRRRRLCHQTLLLNQILSTFHKEIVLPRADRYVHQETVKRLLARQNAPEETSLVAVGIEDWT